MPLTAVMHREKNMLVTRNCKCFMLDRRSKQMCIKGKCIFAWSLHHIAWAEHVGIYDVCVQFNRTWPQASIPIMPCYWPCIAHHHTIMPTGAIGWPVFNGHKQKPEGIQNNVHAG